MGGGYTDGMCGWDVGSRIGVTLACLAVLALAAGAVPWLIARASGDRGLLIGTWLVAMLFGVLYIIGAFTVAESQAGPAYAVALTVGLALGVGVGVTARRRMPSLAALGVIGAGTPAAVPLALFVGSLAATGACLE